MENLNEKILKIKSHFTPIKMLSIILIIMGIVDNLTNPLEHQLNEEVFPEILLRGFFFFCGIYGLLGNGKNISIRSFLVGIPYLYLASLYGIAIIKNHVYTPILPFIITLILGLWVVAIGGYYERRTIGVDYSRINRSNTQPRPEMGRKTKT